MHHVQCVIAKRSALSQSSCLHGQEELVRSYGLAYETIGGGASGRLRILPPGADATTRIGREWSGAPWRTVEGGGGAAGQTLAAGT